MIGESGVATPKSLMESQVEIREKAAASPSSSIEEHRHKVNTAKTLPRPLELVTTTTPYHNISTENGAEQHLVHRARSTPTSSLTPHQLRLQSL